MRRFTSMKEEENRGINTEVTKAVVRRHGGYPCVCVCVASSWRGSVIADAINIDQSESRKLFYQSSPTPDLL
jgi:hypothetical protein